MQKSEAAEFRKRLVMMMSLYKREIGIDMQRVWWRVLAGYDLRDISSAMDCYVTSPAGHYAPGPGDLIDLMRKQSGHISSPEAWALALTSTDESATVVITQQIAQALEVARPCIDAGDKYGARLAFVSAYERLLLSAPPVPVWYASLGDDADGRSAALRKAADDGRLSREYVDKLLPAPAAQKGHYLRLCGAVQAKSVLDRCTSLRAALSASDDSSDRLAKCDFNANDDFFIKIEQMPPVG